MKRGWLISVDLAPGHLDHLSSATARFRSKTPRKRDQDSTFYGQCHLDFIPLNFQPPQHLAPALKEKRARRLFSRAEKTKIPLKINIIQKQLLIFYPI
ncbi:hypothetical protein [Photobacterium sp. WH80]|uniref:hypothetical protein n=1 Tax=Photobacterium sp. WH80 TaxID=2913414 RepID=UPI001EDC8914|nr:hypothetical protein [Photobacterium sp. WH80]MCG2845423.1 hypothetical protein [Photobacterium sp. WH80]